MNTPKVRATAAMTVTSVARARDARPRSAKTARLTVLFADLRGYTGLAERLAPTRILPLLDEFFGVLAGATAHHHGHVYHMAGDGMMAGFGLDDATGEGAREALAAGHAMLQNFAEIAERWRRELVIESGIGVGLHLGEVAMGSLGPPGHRRTTLVGDTVNVAARLCSRARAGELLMSSAVAAALAADATSGPEATSIPVLQLPQFELRGRSEPLDIWCIPASARLAF
ncbi:MAG: adenylate/guanylate cyclase domain-containing protein [Steroidobacteraceae bacterium]